MDSASKPISVECLREALGRSRVCHLSDQEVMDLAAARLKGWRVKVYEELPPKTAELLDWRVSRCPAVAS